jgi:putative dimethyl sulfoxide reductase chaperone
MSTRIDTSPDLIEAAGRATVYALLATGFAVPGAQRLALLETSLLPATAVLELPVPLGDGLRELATELPSGVDAWRDEHIVLFPPITSPDAPSYETAYRGDGIFQQTALLADIAGFYRAHGLRAGGSEKERLDHITVELEFMAVLARKSFTSLRAGQVENAEICTDMAALFLRDHLGCWAPAYGRRVATVSASRWYRALGRLLTDWVEMDMASESVRPTEVVEEPLPFEPPDDGSCGPCGVPEGGAVQ